MATRKDLVEAHAFTRRRLVIAFVSGDAGGRAVEPVRPGRALVGGLVLAVLLVVGAAIAGGWPLELVERVAGVAAPNTLSAVDPTRFPAGSTEVEARTAPQVGAAPSGWRRIGNSKPLSSGECC